MPENDDKVSLNADEYREMYLLLRGSAELIGWLAGHYPGGGTLQTNVGALEPNEERSKIIKLLQRLPQPE
jgi:hypothetical protein